MSANADTKPARSGGSQPDGTDSAVSSAAAGITEPASTATPGRMFSSDIIDIAIFEVAKIIETAANGLLKHNREAALAMLGTSTSIQKSVQKIRDSVIAKVSAE